MWQQNVSWQHGLFTQLDVKRFQTIRAGKAQYAPAISVFKRNTSADGDDWPNLELVYLLEPGDPAIHALQNLFEGGYYCVAVDMRKKTFDATFEITTKSYVRGTVNLTVGYSVTNKNALFCSEDPLGDLQAMARQAIEEFAFQREYNHLTPAVIQQQVMTLQTAGETGLGIHRAQAKPVRWPPEIEEQLKRPIIDQVTADAQDSRNARRIEKLTAMGITHKAIQASVLSTDDEDYQVIVKHIENFARAHVDQEERNLHVLQWLIDNDFMTRTDAQPLIKMLQDRILSGQGQQIDLASFLSGTEDRPQLGQGENQSMAQTSVGKDANDVSDESMATSSHHIRRRQIAEVGKEEIKEDHENDSNKQDDKPIFRRKPINLPDEE